MPLHKTDIRKKFFFPLAFLDGQLAGFPDARDKTKLLADILPKQGKAAARLIYSLSDGKERSTRTALTLTPPVFMYTPTSKVLPIGIFPR